MDRPFPETLLSSLGDLLGMHGLQADRSGCCQLLVDERWLVTLVFRGRTGRIVLHCPLLDPSATADLDPSLLMLMLQASFMGRGAAGATFAIGSDGRACLQWELHAAQVDEHALAGAVEALVSAAQSWGERLRGSRTSAAGAAAVASAFARSLA